jgi:hypothetical protein
VIAQITQAGKKLAAVRIDNDPPVGDPQVVLEATYGWYWIWGCFLACLPVLANARPRHRLGEALAEAPFGPAGIRIMA